MATTSKRDSILGAARGEFAEHGYSGARIERVAACANANKQLIFHYFGSKDGLYTAAVSSVLASVPTPLETAPTPSEGLRRFLSDLATWFDAMPGAALSFVECAPGRGAPAEAIALVSSSLQRMSTALRGFIDDGQRKGFFRDDVEAQQIIRFAVGSIVGSVLMRAQVADGAPAERGTRSPLAQMVIDFCAWR